MKQQDRDQLIRKLRSIWPEGGPANIVWSDVFDEIEAGTAGTALLRLRNKSERCPTIAEFMKEYAGTNTRVTEPTPADDECRLGKCDGSGWMLTTFTKHVEGTGEDRVYTGTYPCDCPAGEARESVFRAAGGTRRSDR